MKSLWRLRRSKVILTLVLMGLTGLFGSVYVALQFDTNLAWTMLVGTPGLAFIALLIGSLIAGHSTSRGSDAAGEGGDGDDSWLDEDSHHGRINPTSGYPMMRGRMDSGGYTAGMGPRHDD